MWVVDDQIENQKIEGKTSSKRGDFDKIAEKLTLTSKSIFANFWRI